MVTLIAGETELFVLHAVWTGGRLAVWAESSGRAGKPGRAVAPGGAAGSAAGGEGPADHPFAASADQLAWLLGEPAGEWPAVAAPSSLQPGEVVLRLPASNGRVQASRSLANLAPQALSVGESSQAAAKDTGDGAGDGDEPDAPDEPAPAPATPTVGERLMNVRVPVMTIGAEEAGAFLERLIERSEAERASRDRQLIAGRSAEYFATVSRFARQLLAEQRFVPMLRQDPAGRLTGMWHPWMSDEKNAERVAVLVSAMPPAARSVVDELGHHAWRVLEACVTGLVDAGARRALAAEDMIETVASRDPLADMHVAWLRGLLGAGESVEAPAASRTEVVRRVRRWLGGLEDRGQSALFRLLLRVNEPLAETLPKNMNEPGDELRWSISFHLQAMDDEDVVIDAADIWLLTRDSITLQGVTLDNPQELLLAELGRASRVYGRLEGSLREKEPFELMLTTREAYEFLREFRPLLIEQGIAVDSPLWWESPAGRLGARLRIEAESAEMVMDSGPGDTSAAGPQLGLTALVGYHWEIAIGDTTLTLNEFEQLVNKSSPLVRINGRWVEIRAEDVENAVKFIRENPGGTMKLSEAMRLAYSSDVSETGVPVLGLEAGGWVADLLGFAGAGDSEFRLPMLTTPAGFKGTLRPYQARGLSWLSFLERFGFGACLADDMGLGKTIQLLALMVHEREAAEARRASGATDEATTVVKPTLLIVPMSVVGNWMHESKRFAPQLKLLVHHGQERLAGDELLERARQADMVVTTYALAYRDVEVIGKVGWGRVVVDEAQNIKNPQAKQSQAVKSIQADRRIALTGTPVENRLTELWSIMDFLNPGYLGPSSNFRRRFSVPIERYRDQHRSAQLRELVKPFILRRVKTDPTVVADLPEKLESREYCHLTPEQAQLYENCVKRMLAEVEQSEGIHRRGLVLAALIKLKQICNHPAQMLKENDPQAGQSPDPSRSGKCVRLLEMLDEVFAEGDQALIFTQFRQMGHILSSMIRSELDRDVLFLHGGTPQGQRVKLIEQFQDGTGKHPLLILSLKAGGVGLNLTAATHVFHFDRWWNPAVENQATDRAYRIGQTRTVHVHKFVVRGTLEERVDEMIEQKSELAEKIVGAGERWLTELDTSELKDILALRADAIGIEE